MKKILSLAKDPSYFQIVEILRFIIDNLKIEVEELDIPLTIKKHFK